MGYGPDYDHGTEGKKKNNKLWEEWRYLQKSEKRVAGKRRKEFRENLGKIWDNCTSDAIEEIQKNRLLSSAENAGDIAFYRDQGSVRKGSIRGSDMVFAEKKRRQGERKEN